MDADVDMTLSYEHKEDVLLHHVVLPRYLPQERSPNLYDVELDLMSKMVKNVEDLSDFIPPKTVELFQRLQRVHTMCTKETISREINALQPGDTFAMFVRLQHTGFMVHVPKTETVDNVQNVIVSTIPNLHPVDIYQHDTDYEFNYPKQAINVKFSQILRSEEFANQLCVLFDGLPVEEKNRDCVSKWLITLLADENSTATSNYPFITKKIRDEILGESKTNYFRRSSCYMNVKVMLQHNLTLQLGAENGKLLYKIVMLKFLINICDLYKNHDIFDIDLLSQMIAKLGRRIEKLLPMLPSTTSEFFNSVITEAKATIELFRQKIDKQTKNLQIRIGKEAQLLPLTDVNFQADIVYKFPKLSKYLNQRKEEVGTSKNNTVYEPKTYKRFFTTGFPSVETKVETIDIPKNDIGERVFWIEFEQMVLYEMKMDDDRWTSDELREWSFAYAQHDKQKSPLFVSRILLVRLKLIAVLDRLTIKTYPLLKEHHSGIDSNIISMLLIPQYEDMRIAYEIEKYFQTRNAAAKDPSLIGENSISDQSFSVKYANQNTAMLKLRRQILELDNRNMIEKMEELERARQLKEQYKREANRRSCEYYTNYCGYDRHSGNCTKCEYDRKANALRVKQYEHLLPKEETQQFAVVFELQIPSGIAHLRDVLDDFVKFCRGDQEDETVKIKGNWTDCLEDFATNETTKNVVLGSTTLAQLENIPVSSPPDYFIIENGYDCMFHSNNKRVTDMSIISHDEIKRMCVFKTQNEYACLQWALESTQHTQNQVLARQSQCRQELTLAEYINFGSLRADGHRLQLRKLYAMIETESLSFENESVLALVMQTLWECGVRGNAESTRESHMDFGDKRFCSAMIKLLEKYVGQQQDNWMNPIKLLIVTLIAVRSFEINRDNLIAIKIAKLLRQIRAIVLKWMHRIEEAIRSMASPDIGTEQELRKKLIWVAITGGVTFFIHPKHANYAEIFQNDPGNDLTALQAWLQFSVCLNNSVRMYSTDESKLPSNMQMFLRLMECVGVFLEPTMNELIKQSQREVHRLIKKLWPRADSTNSSFQPIQFYSDYPHSLVITVIIESRNQIVTIDKISGSFLVDGFPLSRLPNDILNSGIYQWFFGNVVFEVQPDGDSFSTVHRFNDCSYEFKLINGRNIITERKVNVFEKELINHDILDGEFPHHLVKNYSHWWNKQRECIEFRRRAMQEHHFSKVTDIDYRFDLVNKQLCHVQTQRAMLDIKSESFQKIINQLSRLEHPKFILVLLESDHDATVDLLRMNLKFKASLKTNDFLTSNEFSGMRVSPSQNVGTLYGLNHGLVLESISDANTKTILIPNGEILIARTDAHVSVRVITERDLSHKAPFYQYQVDNFCRQLKACNGSYASWFYLAYLHAITSHGEMEPFTGMSGTERALQILQSAYAWSSSPYESEAVTMLKAIANLTPLRKLQKHMQLVEWPENIPPRSSQDCFAFIVQKLLSDSHRLHRLYSERLPKPLKLGTDLKLNMRDHWRCQSFNPNLRVLRTFVPDKQLKTTLPNGPPISVSENTRTVSILYHKNGFQVPLSSDLEGFLTKERQTLDGISNQNRLKELLNHNVHDDFADLWISLYEAARQQELNREEFAVILSFFAHHREEIGPILVLQAVATNPSAFLHINAPAVGSFPISAGSFNSDSISEILQNNHSLPTEYHSKAWEDTGRRKQYDEDLKKMIVGMKTAIRGSWPCNSVEFPSMWSNQFKYIDYENANIEVNKKLKEWYKNYELDVFIKRIESQLKSQALSRQSGVRLPKINPRQQVARNSIKFQIDFEAKIRDCLDALSRDIITQAKDVWETKMEESIRSADDWWAIIFDTISQSDSTDHLIKAGIFPRMIPSLFLPRLVDPDTDDRLKCLIGAWAVEITREQREKRIQNYSIRPELQAILDKEREHEPHINWHPHKYPEWLLFEIEQNLMIRSIQIEIAERMIEPPKIGTRHSVMQLNMGEGKTAVIVPLLAANLANGDQACQITVLKSLFTTNLKSLRQYLGGFLNRKIYLFPCRRDMPIDKHISSILHIYEECLKNKGVILTLPEYRLSFQLKIYEMIENREIEASKNLLEVHNWINKKVRNILDESDAILQAKYQLIYTVGNQMQPDGGSSRWLITQAVLKRVPDHMRRLYREYGRDKIEFDENYVKNKNVYGWADVPYRSDVFTPCRILDETVFKELKKALIADFLEGRLDIDFKAISESKKEKLRGLLMEKAINRETFLTIKSAFSEGEFNTILVLSGLLRFEVLKLALIKRWRVHYGVNDKGKRKMAIPFKAKDVAAELTEFGHPDVAVCFTQMSYYYSGLTKDQLCRVFSILENAPDAAAIYEKWIQSIDARLIVPSIRTYSGVNLDDPQQRDAILFPLLRHNMHVIDFWLSNVVFSQELKMFEKKLMCTAWDLCSDQYKHCVTGFSGTNDTKHILPLTIGQNDLKKLEDTNDEMRKVLENERNQPYKNLPANVSGRQILTELVEHDIPVLLDSGALMLELNNKEVAKTWLKLAKKRQELASKYDAAVYFDEKDTLQTIDHNGIVTEFDYSVYKENLAKCLVYLDDAHTRGTDLKFPPQWKACVTLAGDITRDKTVQSCMRMRQLKTSQSIRFWASYEADIRIRNVCELSPQATVLNTHVIKFIEHNSRQFEIANMVHWTTGALNYTKKLIGHKQYENEPLANEEEDEEDEEEEEGGGEEEEEEENENASIEKLYEKCVDNDFTKLIEMYGEKEEAKLMKIAWEKFNKINGSDVNLKIRKYVVKVQNDVHKKLKKLAPNVKRFTHALDEEQEKELEQEVEEQTQVERPPDAKPAKPILDKRLEVLVREGATAALVDAMKSENALFPIAKSLENTQLSEFCEKNEDAWSECLLVTRDFHTVLDSSSKSCDEFLRPTWWIAQIKNNNEPTKNILVLLSSFECNHLLPAFRRTNKSTLFMYRPRLSKLHSNLLHEEELQVTGSLTPNTIDIDDEIQIGVYSGLMYFKNEAEQNAYCGFLGLIPRPLTAQQQMAYEDKKIDDKGFVPPTKRARLSEEVSNWVIKCKFNDYPADFAIKLIKMHHKVLPKVSHASSILVRNKKVFGVQLDDNDMQVE